MNPEVKQLWINALRSGEYQQGRGYLRVGNKFCCLGVLCDLAVKAGVRMTVQVHPRLHGSESMIYDGTDAQLPERVREWAGLDMRNGEDPAVSDEDGLMRPLSARNDDSLWDFSQIADAIERDL